MSKASREVANLTEWKNPNTPVYGVGEFVCLSVCDKLLPQLFDLSFNQSQKPIEQKFAGLPPRAIFCERIFFLLQKQLILLLFGRK